MYKGHGYSVIVPSTGTPGSLKTVVPVVNHMASWQQRYCLRASSPVGKNVESNEARAAAASLQFGLVWFGLVDFSFNASLEPQPRARRRARLAEDAPARNALWTGSARPNPGTACAA